MVKKTQSNTGSSNLPDPTDEVSIVEKQKETEKNNLISTEQDKPETPISTISSNTICEDDFGDEDLLIQKSTKTNLRSKLIIQFQNQ